MDWSNTLLTLATVTGTIITAIVTYNNARAGIKAKEDRSKLDELKFNSTAKVDAAERLGNISIKLASSLEAQLKDCIAKRDTLDEEVKLKADELANTKLVVRKLLQDVILKHERIADPDCKNSKMITKLMNEVLEEVEKGL